MCPIVLGVRDLLRTAVNIFSRIQGPHSVRQPEDGSGIYDNCSAFLLSLSLAYLIFYILVIIILMSHDLPKCRPTKEGILKLLAYDSNVLISDIGFSNLESKA